MNIKETVKRSNRYFEYMPTDWREGLILGNGSLASIAYAPGGMEWVINKNDVFDRRTYTNKKLLTHEEVLKKIENGERETFFFDEEEKRLDGLTLRSLTPCILRFSNGNGELGWGAPAFPKLSGEIDIYDGAVNIASDAHFVHSDISSVIPRERSVFAIRVSGCAVIDWTHKIELYRPYHDELSEPVWFSEGSGCFGFTQELPGGIGSYAVALIAVPREPDISRVKYALPFDFDYGKLASSVTKPSISKLSAAVSNDGDVDIFVSVFSDYSCEDPKKAAVCEVLRAAKDGYELLRSESVSYWNDFWSKSCLDFGKYKEIQDYALFSMYELASSYSTAPMPALSGMLYGPLNPTTPGVGAHSYTSDQNIQIPLMPASIINHPELVIPLAETFMNAEELMRAHTVRLFGKSGGRGIFIPLVSNQNGEELTSGSYRYTMCGGAYVGLVLARTWEYTRCDEIMREHLFPLLSEINIFYTTNLMHRDDNGIYRLDPGVPPEIFYFTKDDTATLGMLKSCLRIALLWCGKEGIDNIDTRLWADVLENYPTLAERPEGGWWGGPDIPAEHFSFGTHILYPFFPSEEYITEDDRELASKTVEYIDRCAIERTYAGTSGWHFIHDWSWHLYYNTKARLDKTDKKEIWGMLERFLDYFAKPNGFFTHNSVVTAPSSVTETNHNTKKGFDEVTADFTTGPDWYGSGKCATPNIYSKNLTAPVIEGNSIFLLRATESMLSSYDGIIRLFPTVPDGFSGEFCNLIAKGGFLVSASMNEGKLVGAVIYAKENGICRIPDDGKQAFLGREVKHTCRYGIPVIETVLNKGESCKVVPV